MGESDRSCLRSFALLVLLAGIAAICVIFGLTLGALIAGQAVVAGPSGDAVITPVVPPTLENRDGENFFKVNATVPLSLLNNCAAFGWFTLSVITPFLAPKAEQEICLSGSNSSKRLLTTELLSSSKEAKKLREVSKDELVGMLSTQSSSRLMHGDDMGPVVYGIEVHERPLNVGILTKKTAKRPIPRKNEVPKRVLFDIKLPPQNSIYIGARSTRIFMLPLAFESLVTAEVAKMIQNNCQTLGYLALGVYLWKTQSTINSIAPWNKGHGNEIALSATWRVSCRNK